MSVPSPKRAADALDPLVHLAEKGLVPPEPSFSLFHSSDPIARDCLRFGRPGRRDGCGLQGQRLLQDARNLVAESWCRTGGRPDVNGFEVDPWDDDAASWSLLGAVVAVLEREASLAGELPLDELGAALYALADLIETDSLVDWNDHQGQTQANVVAVLDTGRRGLRGQLRRCSSSRSTRRASAEKQSVPPEHAARSPTTAPLCLRSRAARHLRIWTLPASSPGNEHRAPATSGFAVKPSC